MLPWAKGQAPLAECISSRVTESYIAQGTGFNVRSSTSTADFEDSDDREYAFTLLRWIFVGI